MKDQRAGALARILVEYSCDVKQGEICLIQGETAGEPLLIALYEQVLRRGAYPVVELIMEDQSPIFFQHATDAQLDWVPPPAHWREEEANARLRVIAVTNTRAP